MDLHWIDDEAALAEGAADWVAAGLAAKPAATAALATGRTPRGLYRRLAQRRAAGALGGEAARFFNLDEFVGLAPEDPRSYSAYLWKHILGPLQVPAARVRLLRGDARDLAAECRAYDDAIAAAGGLDLAILGLGTNGHIAFNEPGDDWAAGTHVVTLAASTRRAQHHLFAGEAEVPTRGLTMGIATIRAARSVLLLALGEGKAAALAALRAGRPDPAWPATALADHRDLTVFADRRLARIESARPA
jgi:glucosamine-6-phosphate deaminase